LFGALVGVVVDAVRKPGSWTTRGRWRWLLPLILVGCFPLTIVVVLVAAAVFGAWVLVSELGQIERVRRSASYALAIRAGWLVVAILGLVAIVNDTQAVADAVRR
jgi:succinate dehydrogenase/fumarate reductase cytochrome b subunit